MENTYWNSKGKHQELYNKLEKELVPASGRATTVAGEMLRGAANTYYDLYNNGGGNLDSARAKDMSEFLGYLSEYSFPKHQVLKKFFSNFEPRERRNFWGDDYDSYGDSGYSRFDELFTEEVEEALQEALDLIIVEVDKLNSQHKKTNKISDIALVRMGITK